MAINTQAALQKLAANNIDINADFFTLSSSQVGIVLECINADKYRKSKNAPGSTARMYWHALQRKNK